MPAALMITDDQIAALSPAERARLMRRLARPTTELGVSVSRLRRARQVRVTMVLIGAILMVPWTIYLGLTLPQTYRVEDWSTTWVGYDLILLIGLILTIVFGVQRRLLVLLTSFASGVLVLADAWFDISTASGADVPQSLTAALVIELPMGLVLIAGSWRLLHLLAVRLYLLEPGQHLWDIRLDIGRRLADDQTRADAGTGQAPGAGANVPSSSTRKPSG